MKQWNNFHHNLLPIFISFWAVLKLILITPIRYLSTITDKNAPIQDFEMSNMDIKIKPL